MKKNILLFALFLTSHLISYGQEFSKQVTDFIEIQDSIVAITNVTLIDGTGGVIKENQDILFINNRESVGRR